MYITLHHNDRCMKGQEEHAARCKRLTQCNITIQTVPPKTTCNLEAQNHTSIGPF